MNESSLLIKNLRGLEIVELKEEDMPMVEY